MVGGLILPNLIFPNKKYKMKRLSNIRELGRYENIETKKKYNIKKGTNKDRGTDGIFYLYRGKRFFICDKDFYSEKYKKIN